MVTYDAVALNREQKKNIVTNGTIEDCRDAVHADAKKRALTTLFWATSYYGLVAMTQDGESQLSPFIIRYTVEARFAEG